MVPRQQSAGTAGIVAGVALAILFILFFTSGATPETFADPAKAVPFVTQNAGRLRTLATFAIITVIAATFFVAGLAAKLRDRAPTRATGVLYFGLLGIVGHGVGSLLIWSAVPTVVAYAAKDQTGAAYAWVAINAISNAADGFGNLFIGLATLLAGWVISQTGVLQSALGWYGVVAGVVTALAAVAPGSSALFLGSFVLTIVWLLWAGSALRTAA